MSTDRKNVEAARLVLMGTVCGDVIGSVYERHATKRLDFPLFCSRSRFTDDTVCSVGIADALAKGLPFDVSLRHWCWKYPRAGYGKKFSSWMQEEIKEPYYSWGNGSAMRVSPVGAYADTLDECLRLAEQTAEVTHNHPEGIAGAQAVAAAIFLALHGCGKAEIKDFTEAKFGYDLGRRYEDIQPGYRFDVSCRHSVPESIIAFLESTDYESAVRLAVAYGGDADTMAAIAGGIAAAYYGDIPRWISARCEAVLPAEIISAIGRFNSLLGGG